MEDNRREASALRTLQQMAANGPQARASARFQAMADGSPQSAAQGFFHQGPLQQKNQTKNQRGESKPGPPESALRIMGTPVQRQGLEEDQLAQGKFQGLQRQGMEEEDLQMKSRGHRYDALYRETAGGPEYGTQLPDAVRTGVESLSGESLQSVKVHYNSSKPAQLQALAYTQGSDIHVAPGQEQHLAHEAWHVVQQKQGQVEPTFETQGVPVNDDPRLEEEAERMGSRAQRLVIRRRASRRPDPKPAQRQRDRARSGTGPTRARRSPGTSSQDPVQRNVTVAGETYRIGTDEAWANVSALAPITGLTAPQQAQARGILDRWIGAWASSSRTDVVSEDRSYGSWAELASALAGEVLSAANLATENTLAAGALASLNVAGGVGGFMTKIQTWHAARAQGMQDAAKEARGRYRIYYGASMLSFAFGYGTTLHDALITNLPASIPARVTLAADYAMFARRYVHGWALRMTAAQSAARSTHWNPAEGAAWTIAARAANAPLSAGPSATTAQLMTLGQTIGASGAEMEAMAWGIFAFFNNGLDLNQSGTHRFHEVMSVAAQYGVPYAAWAYPAAAP